MKIKNVIAFLFYIGLISHVVAQTSTNRRGVTPEDYFAFQFLSDPRISPNGKDVAYVVTKIDRAQNRRNSTIWLVSTDGKGTPVQLTTSPQSSSSPRWRPDGTALAFISTRPGTEGAPASDQPKPQVYLLSMRGGEAARITNLKNGVGSFQWSPDGRRLVVVSRTGPSDKRTPSEERSDVRNYKNLSYKFNDTGWFDDRRSHIWVVDVQAKRERQLTVGDNWNDSDPQWSPDGTRIAFVSNRTGKEFDDNRNSDVWIIPVEGGELLKISDHDETDNTPRWSPDGQMIAFVGQLHEKDHAKVWLAPASGGVPSSLAATDLDLIPSDLDWSEDGKSLYFGSGVKGEYQLFQIDLNKKTVHQTSSGPRAVRNADYNGPGNTRVYMVNDFKHLDDLYASDLDGGKERQLTHSNELLWQQLQLADIERFTFKGADNWDVDGFLVKPINFDPNKKYPVILSVHGGPAGQYGVDWFHEFQVYAGRGYAVVFTNPRGSTGYGQKFERGISGEWGGKDYQDVMNGLDAALKKYSWLDSERMGVTGGSYGGFMTNWIVGHTDRFKAAVTLRSVSNFVSDEGTRDGAYGHASDFGGNVFDRFDFYWDRSPLKYARNVKTPTLILHSDNDFRVPLEQGEQWFRALKHYGVTTEIVMFPRENHNLTRTGEPRHLVESLNWQLYWFDRFVNGNNAALPPNH